MKSIKILMLLIAFFLTMLTMIAPCSSFESSVLILTERNLSIDVGPEYMLASRGVVQSEDNSLFQMIVINNSTNNNMTNASLFFYPLPMYAEDLSKMNSTAFSEFMEFIMVGAFRLTEGMLISEIPLKNIQGENVTLYTLRDPESDPNLDGGEYNLAIWIIDARNIAMLISNLDEATNRRIIETLEVQPGRC